MRDDIYFFQIEFHGDIGYFSFYLLDKPTIKGDTVTNSKTTDEPTVDEAYATLQRKLKDGLLFNVGNKDQLIETQGELKDPPYKSSFQLVNEERGSQGYSSGALAGLGIGMVILGLAVGGFLGFWFFVKRS
ncbi:hypothetical protein ElyMa_002176300 [Elysia marginata]|uniref:Malectin domain-containing protein n=1 Tax=Elysia marginata TaxID=1093978 RepID=A0AAV4FPS1_9GAST|nr:hypothetical protein ElyMa_002176300 [Elysia marginata]